MAVLSAIITINTMTNEAVYELYKETNCTIYINKQKHHHKIVLELQTECVNVCAYTCVCVCE